MVTITTDSINEFIQSKGGSVSVSELVTFLTGSKIIVCGNVLTVNGATEESTANKKTTCAPGEDSTQRQRTDTEKNIFDKITVCPRETHKQ